MIAQCALDCFAIANQDYFGAEIPRGANLNQGACGCRRERSDPRFAVLRNLKVGGAS